MIFQYIIKIYTDSFLFLLANKIHALLFTKNKHPTRYIWQDVYFYI